MKDNKTIYVNLPSPETADSIQLLRAVLDNSPGNIILLDKNYRILYYNKVIKETLLTLSGKEITIGDDYRDYSFHFPKELFVEAFENAAKGKPTELEAETILGQHKIWFRYNFKPMYEPTGELLGVLVAATDIDNRKRAEINLSNMPDNVDALIENIEEPVLLIDKDYLILQYNTAAKKIIQDTTKKEIYIGANFREFIFPEQFDMFNLLFTESLHGKSHSLEIEIPLRDASTSWARTKIFPVYDRTKNVCGAYILFKNIDVLKKAEPAFKPREEKLQKAIHELTLLNKINDIILTTENENILFERIVKCIVEKGGYKLARVCPKPDPDNKDQWVKPSHAFGETSYLDDIQISLTQTELAKGPTATTLLTGKISVTNNVNRADYFKPWLERANKFGIASSIVIPIYASTNSKVTGALNIYSENTDAFDANETAIMERLGNNVSLAIRSLRNRKEKDEASYFLNERVKELSTIYQVNNILQNESHSIDEVFTKIVNLLPAGWQFVEVCESLIQFDHKAYHTPNYKPSPFSQKAEINTQDGKSGFIEVIYTEEKPSAHEGPFLKEERDLINTLAEMIQVHYNKKLNEEVLIKSRANLNSIFDNTDVGHLLLDDKYKIISFNQRFANSFAVAAGIKLEVNKNFIDLLLTNRKDFALTNFTKIATNLTPIEYETSYTTNEINYFFNIRIAPVRSASGLLGFCLSAYDITKRKLMELEHQKIISELTQHNKDLQQFAYIVSHNLRAPLANILGLNAALKQPLPEETKEHLLSYIEISAQKLDEVIRDLNDILQVRGDVVKIKEQVQLHTLAANVTSSIEQVLIESHATIELDFTAADTVLAIRSYMVSIFYNLISNSIKYARPQHPPHIRIYTERNNDGYILIHFKDNGMGIDLKKYDTQLFGLYKRFHVHLQGKGMGLFMVKAQVEAMGGRIDVKSTPEIGTEFIISLKEV